MKQLVLRLCFVSGVLLCVGHAAADATTTSSPLQVKRCDLEIRGGRAGGYSSTTGFTGYTSGWTPGAPYYFNDPLGASYYQPPTSGSSNLFIDFVNVTNKEMKVIEFGAEYRGVLVAEARDVGTFSPNADIKRKYGVNPNLEPPKGLALKCEPLKIEYADGTVWTRSSMPSPSPQLYKDHP